MTQGQPPPGQPPRVSDAPTISAASRRADEHAPEPLTPIRHLGDFDLHREIGRGGMGIVYEARQISLNRSVALKILPPGLGLTGQAVQRFEREAQAAAKLHHTNIVPVYAIGEEDGCHFYAMELIEGQSLARILDDLRDRQSNPLLEATVARTASEAPARPEPPAPAHEPSSTLSDTSSDSREWFDAVARLTAEVAEALHYAHGRGIIHRDIKPANLLMSHDGRLCVTDFGLARVAQEPGMTVSGSFLGTAAYMSPEQIAAGRVQVDHRTDVYSLGAVLYETLTLERPFPGDSREKVLSGIMTKDPVPPRRINPRVPVDLETICLKAMEKDPDRRYQDAGGFASDLRQFLGRGLITARRAGPVKRVAKWVRRHPVASVSVLAVVVVALLVGVALQQGFGRSEANARRLVSDAEVALKEGRYHGGLALLDEAMAVAPDLPEARRTRGRLLLAQLWPSRELANLANRILAENPDDWEAHAWLASAGLLGLADIPAAEHAATVERLAPDTADAWFLKGAIQTSALESLRCYNRALELDPGHYFALLLRASTNVGLKDFPGAISDAERVIAVQAKSPRGRALLAMSYTFGMHDPERALAEFEKALALDPEDSWTYLQRSTVYSTLLHQYERSLADLTKASELAGGNVMARSARAGNLLILGRNEEALTEAQEIVQAEPDLIVARYPIINALYTLKRPDELQTAADALRQRADGWADQKAAAQAYCLLAGVSLVAGKTDMAAADASKAITLDPANLNGYVTRAQARRRTEGQSAVDQECDRIAGLDLKEPEPLYNRGSQMYSLCSRPEAALTDFARVIAMAPAWADAYSERGRILMRERRYKEALEDHDKAVELAPKWADALFRRSVTHVALDQWQETLADLDRYFTLGAEGRNARLYQAIALAHLGRDEEALAATDRTIQALPRRFIGYSDRAFVLFWFGRVDEAIASLDKAIEVQPTSWESLIERAGVACYKPAPCERIVADLGKAEELGRQEPSAWQSLAWAHVADLWGTCPSDVNLSKALELARLAVGANPSDYSSQFALGIALFRNGKHEEAREALLAGLSLELPGSDSTVPALCTLAMSEWKMGREDEARASYARALEHLKRGFPKSPLNIKFQQEAARLLGGGT